VFPLYALLKGELFPGAGHVSLWQAVVFQLGTRQSSGSILDAHSQARSLFDNWRSEDPWLIGSALAALPVVLAVRRLRPIGVGLLVGLLVAVHGGYLPQPYVIALLPLSALAAVGALEWCWRWRPARIGVAALIGLAAILVLPGWARADVTAMTTNTWAPFHSAESWVEANVPRHDRVLVDDTMWVDLEEYGFDGHLNVVWYSKLGSSNNLDPSVERALPGGWKDFGYVVVTPSIRASVAQDPSGQTEVIDAIRHSRVVASFGSGANQVTIQRIEAGGTNQ
jgi:hypothetical protein